MVDAAETGLLVAVLSVVVGTPITFYLKDYLVARRNYRNFKDKLEKIAGVNAEVLYPVAGGMPGSLTRTFKIIDINRQGLVLQDKLSTIFVPSKKVLQTEMILPAENYETLRRAQMERDFNEVINAMFPPLIDKIKEVFVTELLSGDTDLSAVVGVKVTSVLKDAGVDTSKILEKKPTIRRLLEELEEAEETEKTKKKSSTENDKK